LGSEKAQVWLERELQAVLVERDVEILVQHVLGFLKSVMKGMTSIPGAEVIGAVQSAVEPYVPQYASIVAEEFLEFIASGLTVAAYDMREAAGSEEGSTRSMPNE
jgi:hypothetical protein